MMNNLNNPAFGRWGYNWQGDHTRPWSSHEEEQTCFEDYVLNKVDEERRAKIEEADKQKPTGKVMP